MAKSSTYKIVFTGPESSGKSTIAQLAAQHFKTDWVSEYSRSYLEQLDRPYVQSDLIAIAKGQLNQERLALNKGSKKQFLFIDTSLLVLKVWSIFKYGNYNFELEKMLLHNLPHYYFLCDFNIPWEYDPLRENRYDREQLHALYKKELLALNVPFFELKGGVNERMQSIISILGTFPK